MKVYQIGEDNGGRDFIMATSEKEAIEVHRTIVDDDHGPIRELSNEELEKHEFIDDPDDPNSGRRTFAEELKRRIAAGDGPDMLATSEY